MRVIKHNKIRLSKILLLAVMLLVVMAGLTTSGCVKGLKPVGWSGGVVADETLFLGSTEGRLVAVSLADGTRQWSEQITATSSGGFGCASSSAAVPIYGTPVVAGDLVYVSGYNGKIYAFDSTSLQKRWVYPAEGNLQSVVGGPVVALGRVYYGCPGSVYFGCSDGKVYALNSDTGTKTWESSPTGDKIWSTPVVDGDTIYISSFDKKVHALDAATGEKKWETPETGGAIASPPIVYKNKVYFGSFDRHMYAVGANDGKLKWKSEVEAGNWFWAKPVIYNDAVYAPCLDGKVYILDAESGHELMDAIDLGSPLSSSPVLVDDSIIIVSEEGKVYSIKDNQKRELKDLEAKVYSPLCASNGVVYIHAQEDEALYALNVQTGAEVWQVSLVSE